VSAFTTSAPGSRHAATPPWEKADAGFMAALPGAGAWMATMTDGELHVIRTQDGGLWHLSVSHTTRLPSWDEIADARYRFVPDRARMAMLLPPRAEWIDVHPRTLHLWEIDDPGSTR